MFSFIARAEKGIARHIDVSSVVVVIFDWFVLSMRMQVILDSSFARPGSDPIWGGKKVEFRDWTTHGPKQRITDKTRVLDFISESPLNTDTPKILTMQPPSKGFYPGFTCPRPPS